VTSPVLPLARGYIPVQGPRYDRLQTGATNQAQTTASSTKKEKPAATTTTPAKGTMQETRGLNQLQEKDTAD